MSIADATVNRIYKCDNESCSAEIFVTQIVREPWHKTCPFCYEDTLYVKSGDVNMCIIMDIYTPTTLGSLGEKNYQEMIKRDGPIKEPPKPWWRKGKKKVDFSILRNPKRYVETGHL